MIPRGLALSIEAFLLVFLGFLIFQVSFMEPPSVDSSPPVLVPTTISVVDCHE